MTMVQAALEAEMTEPIGAAKGERTERRLFYRSGYYGHLLITRVGTLELRVPQDRLGRFSTEPFECYQRSDKALIGMLAEMCVQGVWAAMRLVGTRGALLESPLSVAP